MGFKKVFAQKLDIISSFKEREFARVILEEQVERFVGSHDYRFCLEYQEFDSSDGNQFIMLFIIEAYAVIDEFTRALDDEQILCVYRDSFDEFRVLRDKNLEQAGAGTTLSWHLAGSIRRDVNQEPGACSATSGDLP